MEADRIWQELGPGIGLLNLLMLYPAPGNPAILEMLERLIEPESLRLARLDLDKLQARLSLLPDGPGPVPTATSFSGIPDSPLRRLMTWLALLDALYQGKLRHGCTQHVQQQLSELHAPEPEEIARAIGELHQMKSAAL